MTTAQTSVVATPFGPVKMDGELPAQESVSDLFDQLDFQQATQAYIWALPIVSFAQWQHVHAHEFGAKNGDLVYYQTYTDKMGIITGNANTPYTMSFINLSSGPMVVEIPEQEIGGGFNDFWQRSIGTIGQLGVGLNKGGKFILLPPGVRHPEDPDGYVAFTSPTTNVFFGLRILETDPQKSMAIAQKVKVYPLSQRGNPPATSVLTPGGRRWYGNQPRGMAYWVRLHAILQEEPVADRDRFFMAMLHNLGIEKGRSMAPTARQQKALLQGSEAGELMAQVNCFARRFQNGRHWPDRQWHYVMVMKSVDQTAENHDLLLERASYFYEGITYGRSNMVAQPGMGQALLGGYNDARGAWLDGARTYSLHVAPDPPAKIYWSINVYDVATRGLIDNETGKGDLFSQNGLLQNTDGSFTLHFGPRAPLGREKNWVQTVNGRHWFVWFRLFYPLEAFFDKSWKMGDFQEEEVQ